MGISNPAMPMAGVRVLDIATFIAAPMAAAILGEFGADVIKIEQPGGGDPWRRYGTKSKRADSTLAWLTEARNKRSLTLNLKAPEGAEIFKRLVKEADIVTENFRPGTLEKWGLGYDVLSEINPKIILMRVSGYGQTGPYRTRPGFARIAHAFGGLTHLAGMPGGPPVTPGSTSLGDYMTGMYGAIGCLLALRERDRSGKGQEIDLALYESVFRALDELAPAFAATGFVRDREGISTVNACPHGHFQCGDGRWVAIACTSDKMFERLARAMGKPELSSDKLYATTAKRLADREKVEGLVSSWTGSMDRDRVIEACVKDEVPIGAVNAINEIFDDPHFQARGNLETVNDPETGPVTVPAVIPRLSRTPGEIRNLGPALGNANQSVLEDLLGFSAKQITDLKAKGVV
ncbi:MAG: CoA transferase [Rhodospirillales bacterium]|jgi:crotonobetainyl-CoA:carnitine CoA-transferase CaiB-like acyl-CoA transferase